MLQLEIYVLCRLDAGRGRIHYNQQHGLIFLNFYLKSLFDAKALTL